MSSRSRSRASPSTDAPSSLDTLLKRAEEYPTSRTSGGAASNTASRRLTEKEGDDEILRESESTKSIIRLTTQPPNIKFGTLKPYQLAGLNWLIQLYESNLSGILADEMGLGKTLQSISLLAYLRQYRKIIGPHLIVVPKSTLGNWGRELNKWCPSINVFSFHGDKTRRKQLIKERFEPRDFDVIVTSYEMVLIEKSLFKKVEWHMMIVDEAHRLKNENSVLSQILRILHSKGRLLLTGTPLQNNLHELWALLNFLMPSLFDSSEEFDSFLETEKSEALLQRLHHILKPFLLRRLKSEVAKELPPKKETLLFVGMAQLQKQTYRNVLQRDLDALHGNTKQRTRLLNIVMQLRKAANHPYLFEGVEDRSLPAYGEHMITSCGKMIILDKLLKRLKEKQSRVLIFSQMTRQLDILEDYCVYREFEYCRIDGNTSSEIREQHIDDFNAENSTKFLFLLSTRAGGLGINLATADIVVLYDSDWNPQMDLQAQDRAHRIGQKKPVHVYRLVTQHSIEEKVIERAELKLQLDALVIQQGRLANSTTTKISKDEMLAMIRYGADEVFRSKDSTMTDEDIEMILKQAEERTTEFNEKLKKHSNTIFSSTGEWEEDETEKQRPMLLIEESTGEDGKSEKKAADLAFLNKVSNALGKRERQKSRNYDVDQYYRSVMTQEKNAQRRRNVVPRPRRLPVMHDYQFYEVTRLNELHAKEEAYWQMQASAPKDEEDESTNGLTPEEEHEKQTLLSQGFGEWNRRDLYAFLRCCERYGREKIEKIQEKVPNKTEDQVRRYHSVFWARHHEIEGIDRMLKSIAKGEERRLRATEIQEFVERLVRECKGVPEEQLVLKYSSQLKGKGYTSETDRYLMCQVAGVGYGEWDQIWANLRTSQRFSFDYFLRSRTPAELGKRVDALVRVMMKDVEKNKTMNSTTTGKRTQREEEGKKEEGEEKDSKKMKIETQQEQDKLMKE